MKPGHTGAALGSRSHLFTARRPCRRCDAWTKRICRSLASRFNFGTLAGRGRSRETRHKIQMHSFLQVESLGVNRCRKSWTNSKSSIHQVYATSSEYPGKRKDHRWCQSSSSAKSLRCEIRGSVPWRDWKTRAMYPKQGLGPCQKHLQAQSERQGYILLACRNWVLPSASARQPEEREFVVDSGASMHMVSEQDLNSAELETMSTSRSPTTVMTAKARGANE